MSDVLSELQRVIDSHLASGDGFRLLEAGCGSMSKVQLSEKVHITGIDISEMQLARNNSLDERIVGDIQTWKFPKHSFDIIICWEVLEHLNYPDRALDNFFDSVKPGGLIILAYPNLYSLKGMITKFTPHQVHIWYYRHLLHRPDAGINDTAPFTTPFRSAATYPTIRRLAKSHSATEVFFALRESSSMQYVRQNFWALNLIMKTASFASRALTMGRVDLIQSDVIQVLQTSPGA